ncbi:MerR family transcriptional regulator [Paenibacillus turpanensis]|uniref:MerR family transcriptional regulator n=1 Tax=Paenibacillus turpanensis TaxID=2689078 RepID=UPI001407FAA5|nr:MerR family transcriptional regulator [Paenibacillus turpanensis]
MRIQEIARKLNMTPRAIRFYEEKGLIKPERPDENGYRSYSDSDAWRLQTISALREIGLPLEEVRSVLASVEAEGPMGIRSGLETQRSLLFQQWTGCRELIRCVDGMLEKLDRNDMPAMHDLFELADRMKRWKQVRETWEERLHFDSLAAQYDELLKEDRQGLGDRQGAADEKERMLREQQAGTSNPNEMLAQRLFPIGASYDQVLDRIVEWIDPEREESGLDAATGTGNLAGRFIARGVRMAAFDQSKGMLRKAKEKAAGLDVKLGNLLAIPYFDEQFHFAVTSFSFRHLTLEECGIALEELCRVLKRGGRLCIADDFSLVQAGSVQEIRQVLVSKLKELRMVTVQQPAVDHIHLIYAVKR